MCVKNESTLILYICLFPRASNYLTLNMKIVLFMWNIVKEYFYQKEVSDSEEKVFLTLETVLDHPPRQIFYVSRPKRHIENQDVRR